MTLAETIQEQKVDTGHVSCWWLGGSGFAFKTTNDTVIYIDPYLSNVVKTIFGVGRGFVAPISAEEVRADAVIATHKHEDHLDPGSIAIIAKNNPEAKFIMPPSATAHALGWGLSRNQVVSLQYGQTVEVREVTIEATPARHDAGIPGWEVPDAMGVILRTGNLTIYQTGDTEYDLRLRRLKTHHPDVAILCINGVGGNMDAHEAALLAWQLEAAIAIPMHHYLWEAQAPNLGETLDPELFVTTYRRLGGKGRAVVPEVGSHIDLMRANANYP